MSGGYFDYYQHHISEIADKLEKTLADIEYAKSIVTIKKKEVYAHLLDTQSGKKSWPNWLLESCYRYNSVDDVKKSLNKWCDFHEKDGKIYFPFPFVCLSTFPLPKKLTYCYESVTVFLVLIEMICPAHSGVFPHDFQSEF